MALSSCPKCDSSVFELQENTPAGSPYSLIFVQCASCGSVVGVMDFSNIGTLMRQQNKAIKAIAAAVGISVNLET